MKTIILICVLTALQTVFSNGMIKGNVVSSDNAVLTEANITVIGTTLGSATDEKGRFVIRGIPKGRYIIRCSHLGFTDEFMRGITVGTDTVTELEFVLEPTEYQLQGIEVEKRMDDFEAMMKTRNLASSEFFAQQNVEMPKPKGKIRVNTRVGFWERIRHFFRKL
jgi:hypothetical protein